MSAIPIEDAKNGDNPLVKFLNYKTLPFGEEELYVVAFRPRETKAGKKMAYLVLADSTRSLHSVVVFPTNFAKAYMKIKEGNYYKFSLGKTKDETIIMEDVIDNN
jgi:DNA polymerase III alpha subunit